MAHRTASAPLDADNNAGSYSAVRNDWHCGVADFHLGTGTSSSHSRCRIYDCKRAPVRQSSVSLYLRGESIYVLLGRTRARYNQATKAPESKPDRAKLDR
jgi:hypothetical protein